MLRDSLGFDGLVFSDALNMKGVTNGHKGGEMELMALKAGNDVLLFPEDVGVAINKIKEALNSGELSEAELALHVKRILAAK
jgi:beta-glucosidase-like glycosyl hydrolase